MVELEVEVSDPALLSSLARWLGRSPDTRVRRVAVPPGAGELGAADIVIAVVSSSALAALVQVIPEFIRSKRSPVVVKLRHKGRTIEVSADNATDAATMLDKLTGQ
ncbi:hypothetical protein ADL15_21350 [Actinoplanes awajinensis subsp. mycoplanecinus]|uniref:Uncharacterized protein n=1 Tax=Actinoplanes awajinensis subsp. mycoplanecinus TaxID=135947 RepID=A0A101JRM5_9ACTN|nr:hypothetical protein ADL15_21350 [Actinoplanes awajinensis subsp. mycoplanecinus]